MLFSAPNSAEHDLSTDDLIAAYLQVDLLVFSFNIITFTDLTHWSNLHNILNAPLPQIHMSVALH